MRSENFAIKRGQRQAKIDSAEREQSQDCKAGLNEKQEPTQEARTEAKLALIMLSDKEEKLRSGIKTENERQQGRCVQRPKTIKNAYYADAARSVPTKESDTNISSSFIVQLSPLTAHR